MFYLLKSFRILKNNNKIKIIKKQPFNNLNKIFIILLINLLNTMCCSVPSPARTSVFLTVWYLAL